MKLYINAWNRRQCNEKVLFWESALVRGGEMKTDWLSSLWENDVRFLWSTLEVLALAKPTRLTHIQPMQSTNENQNPKRKEVIITTTKKNSLSFLSINFLQVMWRYIETKRAAGFVTFPYANCDPNERGKKWALAVVSFRGVNPLLQTVPSTFQFMETQAKNSGSDHALITVNEGFFYLLPHYGSWNCF